MCSLTPCRDNNYNMDQRGALFQLKLKFPLLFSEPLSSQREERRYSFFEGRLISKSSPLLDLATV